jgi:tricorn protease
MGWTRDGRSMLFTSNRVGFNGRVEQLFTVPASGGPVTPVPLGTTWAAYSPDGTHLAYVPGWSASVLASAIVAATRSPSG